MATWTPYALVCLYRVLLVTTHINPNIALLPALFAKSSLVWTSILCVCTNMPIKKRTLHLFRLRSEITESIAIDSKG